MHSHRGNDRLAGPTTPPCPGLVVGSPVHGDGSPLSVWVGRSPVVPSGWGNCPPILHPAGRVQCLRGRVLPGPKMRPATSLTVFVATIANPASPAPASVVSAMLAVMAWTVSRQVFRVTSYQTWRPTPMACTRMKMPMPRATSHCVTLQGLRSFSEGKGCPLCGILVSLPVFPGPRWGRGVGRRGSCPGRTSRHGVRSVAHPWLCARFAARL